MALVINGTNVDAINIEQGAHPESSNQFCVMELIDYIVRGGKSDSPLCVDESLRTHMINWNDSLQDQPRQILKSLIPDLIGTRPIKNGLFPVCVYQKDVKKFIKELIYFELMPWLLDNFKYECYAEGVKVNIDDLRNLKNNKRGRYRSVELLVESWQFKHFSGSFPRISGNEARAREAKAREEILQQSGIVIWSNMNEITGHMGYSALNLVLDAIKIPQRRKKELTEYNISMIRRISAFAKEKVEQYYAERKVENPLVPEVVMI